MKVTLPGALFLVFLTLKLCGVIAWSWWWVFAPIWGVFVAAFVAALTLEVRKALRT